MVSSFGIMTSQFSVQITFLDFLDYLQFTIFDVENSQFDQIFIEGYLSNRTYLIQSFIFDAEN